MDSIIRFTATYLYLVPMGLLAATWIISRPGDRLLLLQRTAIATVVALILVVVATKLVIETRPYLALHQAPLVAHPPTDNSFPSDHAAISFTVALVALPFSPAIGVVSLFAATMVGLGRIAAHLHWPIDVVASIGIAGVANLLALLAFRKTDVHRRFS